MAKKKEKEKKKRLSQDSYDTKGLKSKSKILFIILLQGNKEETSVYVGGYREQLISEILDFFFFALMPTITNRDTLIEVYRKIF